MERIPKRSVGVIGGLGPETTAEFYLSLIRRCRVRYPDGYPHIVIDNVPVPFDLEREAVVYGRGIEDYTPLLIQSAKRLEHDGVDFITLPCNTVHEVYPEIQASVEVPVVNILETTAEACREKGVRRVAVLGTLRTITKKLYNPALERAGIGVVPLEHEEIEELSQLIYTLLKGQKQPEGRDYMLSLLSDLEGRGAEAVILGCTDLQLLLRPSDTDLPVPAVDSVESLVEETTTRIGYTK